MKSSLRTLLLWAVTPLWFFPLAWALAFSVRGWVSCIGHFLIYSELAAILFLLLAFATLLFGPIGLLFRNHRRQAAGYMVVAAVFILSFFGGFRWRMELWRSNITRVAQQGQPLVDAITAYNVEHGRSPGSLEELVPGYIDRIPDTGIGMWPDFQYVVGQPDKFDGNEWVLLVTPPNLPMGFDQFMYFPRQNYPRVGYGGGIERIGTWGYVHE
jgi:hypothetical protein